MRGHGEIERLSYRQQLTRAAFDRGDLGVYQTLAIAPAPGRTA